MNAHSLRSLALAAAGTLVLTACATAPAGKGLPSRPEKLAFGPLAFEVPRSDELRHELAGGVVAYVVPDRSLPLVEVTLHLRTGDFREPADRPGLAALAATLARVGGTATRTPEEFDERADFLAANLQSFIGATSGGASVNALSRNLGDSLDLLFDMLANPRFEDSRLGIEKGNLLELDEAAERRCRQHPVPGVELLVVGPSHFSARPMTAKHLDALWKVIGAPRNHEKLVDDLVKDKNIKELIY